MTQTDRLAIPLMAPGQAQKDVTHNEALLALDLLCQSVAASADLADPPASPTPGTCWIVAPGATGDWSGKEGMLAGWTASGWRFASPAAGWQVWIADRGHAMRHDGTGWTDGAMRADGLYISGQRIVTERQAAISDPSGGVTIDSEARDALVALMNALRAHGLIEP